MIAKKEMTASTPPATAPALGLLETAGSSAMLDREGVCVYVCVLVFLSITPVILLVAQRSHELKDL